MRFNGKTGNIKVEKGEPALRSCWECNSAHKHLKKVNTLHSCFTCGRMWVFNRYLSSFKTPQAVEAWLIKKGVKKNGSTKKIDAGYRVMVFSFGKKGEKK